MSLSIVWTLKEQRDGTFLKTLRNRHSFKEHDHIAIKQLAAQRLADVLKWRDTGVPLRQWQQQ